jgi:glycine cleavage system H protein
MRGVEMPEYLETTSDKFTFRVATDRLYSPEGLWIQPEAPSRVRIGLTDFMQQRSGDLAFLSVKPPGTRVQVGDDFAEMETVKVTQTIPSPVAGAILEVNKALDVTPEVVNGDPYGGGWLALLEVANWDTDRAKLLDANAYFSVMKSQIEQEVQKQ